MIVDHDGDGDGDTFNPIVITEGEGTPPWLAQKRRLTWINVKYKAI